MPDVVVERVQHRLERGVAHDVRLVRPRCRSGSGSGSRAAARPRRAGTARAAASSVASSGAVCHFCTAAAISGRSPLKAVLGKAWKKISRSTGDDHSHSKPPGVDRARFLGRRCRGDDPEVLRRVGDVELHLDADLRQHRHDRLVDRRRRRLVEVVARDRERELLPALLADAVRALRPAGLVEQRLRHARGRTG